jgi:L-asparaginase II
VGVVDSRRLGVAVKVADGSQRPISPVIMMALVAVGALSGPALDSLRRFQNLPIHNCHGLNVGSVSTVFDLSL